MDEKTKDYFERRRLVWCAAYGAAFAERWELLYKKNGRSMREVVEECTLIAQEACMSFPAPGEEAHV